MLIDLQSTLKTSDCSGTSVWLKDSSTSPSRLQEMVGAGTLNLVTQETRTLAFSVTDTDSDTGVSPSMRVVWEGGAETKAWIKLFPFSGDLYLEQLILQEMTQDYLVMRHCWMWLHTAILLQLEQVMSASDIGSSLPSSIPVSTLFIVRLQSPETSHIQLQLIMSCFV